MVRIEAGRISGDVNSVGPMEICGAQGNGGGVLDLDMEMRRRRKNAVGSRFIGESVTTAIALKLWSDFSRLELHIPDYFANLDATCLMH